MYVCIYLSIYLSIYVCMYICMYVCIYVCMYVCMCISLSLYIYIYIYAYVYIYIYIYTYISNSEFDACALGPQVRRVTSIAFRHIVLSTTGCDREGATWAYVEGFARRTSGRRGHNMEGLARDIRKKHGTQHLAVPGSEEARANIIRRGRFSRTLHHRDVHNSGHEYFPLFSLTKLGFYL